MIWTVVSLHIRIASLRRKRRKTDEERAELHQLTTLAFGCEGCA